MPTLSETCDSTVIQCKYASRKVAKQKVVSQTFPFHPAHNEVQNFHNVFTTSSFPLQLFVGL